MEKVLVRIPEYSSVNGKLECWNGVERTIPEGGHAEICRDESVTLGGLMVSFDGVREDGVHVLTLVDPHSHALNRKPVPEDMELAQ